MDRTQGAEAIERQIAIVAAASATMRALLRREFDPRRFDVQEASNGAEAERLASEFEADLILLDASLPDKDGLEVCRVIASAYESGGPTIIMITDRLTAEQRTRAVEAGARGSLRRDFTRGELGAYFCELERRDEKLNDTTVLIVDDAGFMRTTVSRVLSRAGATMLEADHGEAALAIMAEHEIDVVLTDYRMPVMDGVTFVEAVRSDPNYAAIPVLMLTASEDHYLTVQALEAGASDCIRKPFQGAELVARVRTFAHIAQLTRKMQELSRLDELTGLFNRREAFSQVDRMVAASRQNGTPLFCLMLDLDEFRHFNRAYGPLVADHVLREVAEALETDCRPGDALCRIGDDSFIVLCPNTRIGEAEELAEALRRRVASCTFTSQNPVHRLTASVGVSRLCGDNPGPEQLFIAAEEALTEAQALGHNRVVMAGDRATADRS